MNRYLDILRVVLLVTLISFLLQHRTARGQWAPLKPSPWTPSQTPVKTDPQAQTDLQFKERGSILLFKKSSIELRSGMLEKL